MSWLDWLKQLFTPPGPVTPPGPIVPPGPINSGPTDQEFLQANNAARRQNNRSPQQWSDKLALAARNHANHMASTNNMNHQGIGDGTPWDRISNVGYRYTIASENVAAGYLSLKSVMEGWMNSLGHRINILSSATETGYAVSSSSSGKLYWCSVFASPAIGDMVTMVEPTYVITETQDGDCLMSSITMKNSH